jgi:hypothetical protein
MMQRKTPSILKLACAFTALSAAAVASPAQAFQPRDTHEVNAVNVRILQSEMMVAALTCNMHTRYNTVVVRYQGELVSHARVLKKMFRRDHGARAQSELDGFVTQLANDASIRSIRERQTFCTNATKMFSSILSGENTLAATGLRTVEEAVVQEMPSK